MKKAIIICHKLLKYSTMVEYYEKSAQILNAKNISTATFGEDRFDKMAESIYEYAKSHDVVLVIMHTFFDLYDKIASQTLPNNVRLFGGFAVSKAKQFEIFDKHNIPVAPWMSKPSSWDEVFNKLGDKIIAKPIFGDSSKGIKVINIDDDHNHKLSDDMVYCKYIRSKNPPYIQCRTNFLFDHCVVKYSAYSNENKDLVRLRFASKSNVVTETVMNIGMNAHKVISKYYPNIAMTGSDIMVDENGSYVLEINTQAPGLTRNTGFLDIGAEIAKACISKLNKISK